MYYHRADRDWASLVRIPRMSSDYQLRCPLLHPVHSGSQWDVIVDRRGRERERGLRHREQAYGEFQRTTS